MRVEILDEAEADLVDGFWFYERQAPGLGEYFLDSLYSDIDSLQLFGGIHPIRFGYHRQLSQRFPFAISYRVQDDAAQVYAVLDCRRDPDSLTERLGA